MAGLTFVYKGADVNPNWVNRILIYRIRGEQDSTAYTATIAAGGSLDQFKDYYYRLYAVYANGTYGKLLGEEIGTTTSTDLSVDIAWTADLKAKEYRLYRGTTINLYDGYIKIPALGITEAGDTGSQLSSWTLTGAKSGVYYWELVRVTGTPIVKVKIYKDFSKNALSLVAEGKSLLNGTVNLEERNVSGIYGSVVVAYSADDTDIGNTLTIAYANSYTDDGTSILNFIDYHSITWDNVESIQPIFSETVKNLGDEIEEGSSIYLPPLMAKVCIILSSGEKLFINTMNVLNQSTWSTGTQEGVNKCVKDLNDWKN
jgi:hypothetical protein